MKNKETLEEVFCDTYTEYIQQKMILIHHFKYENNRNKSL